MKAGSSVVITIKLFLSCSCCSGCPGVSVTYEFEKGQPLYNQQKQHLKDVQYHEKDWQLRRELFNDEGVLDGHDDHYHDQNDPVGEENVEFSSSTTPNSDTSSLSSAPSRPWGYMIGATLLVNAATFTGVFVVAIAGFQKRWGFCPIASKSCRMKLLYGDVAVSAIASGALMAAAVLLIMPEASRMMLVDDTVSNQGEHRDHLLLRRSLKGEEDHEEHADAHAEVSWLFGVSAMAGFLLQFLMKMLFHTTHGSAKKPVLKSTRLSTSSSSDPLQNNASFDLAIETEGAEEKSTPDTGKRGEEFDAPFHRSSTSLVVENNNSKSEDKNVAVAGNDDDQHSLQQGEVDWSLCGSILLGDAFHNFADGIFIASAFLSCGAGAAVGVFVSTLYHEMVQELADFLVLTNHAHLTISKALALNFLSGLSVTLGGVVLFVAGPSLTELGVGALLNLSAGVYIYIASVECMPRIGKLLGTNTNRNSSSGRGQRLLEFLYVLGMFAVGAVPIGLCLIAHEHCE